MAKVIADEVLKFSLEINGNPAQKELAKLTDTHNGLKKVLKDLNEQESTRRKELDKLTKEYAINAKVAGDMELQSKKLFNSYQTEKSKLSALENQYGKNSKEYKEHNKIVNSLLNSSAKLEDNFENLKEKNVKLSPTIDKLNKEYKDLKGQIKDLNVQIDANSAKIYESQNKIGLSSLTMDQLTKKARELSIALRYMIPDTANHIKLKAELNEVKERMSELNGKAAQSKLSISSLADSFNKYAALGASVVAGLTGVVVSIQGIIAMNGKLSDSQADVMKTTGMSKKEVDELTKSFGLLETRTSRIDLLKIAEQGGRLGVPKAEIQDFVKSMNMAAVALGDSFTGGVDEVAEKLGKIKFLFKETKDMGIEQAYQSIGSAINDLGANGTANEANIAEFTKRIGSLTDVLKPTVQETLALGTAFEESGIEAETSSRAYNIFMKQASTESGKFAQVMGISKKAVEDMINTNPMNFMLDFAKGMNGMNATEVAKTLEFLGVNADGANKVIGAMGNNFDRFHQLIDLSNNSFANGTSLINEYNIKNETLGATLEKISKKISGAFSSEIFINWLSVIVQGFAKFIGATESAEKRVSWLRISLGFTAKLFAILVASMISYTAWSTLVALTTKTTGEATAWAAVQKKLDVMWTSLQIVVYKAYSYLMTSLGIETQKTTAKLAVLNATASASPWGAVLAVLTAIVGVYLAYRGTLTKTIEVQETFASQHKKMNEEVSKSTSETKANMSSLIGVIKAHNVSMESKIKAYNELIKISPAFNGFLKDEKFNIEGLLEVYNQYLKSLDAVAYARSFSQLNEANVKKQIDAENKLFTAEKNMLDARKVFDDPNNTHRKIGASKRLDIIEAMQESELAAKQAKLNYDNSIKIVDDTNKFREDKIKKLEDIIKNEETKILSLTDKSSTKYKVASIKLENDKKQLEALLGVTVNTNNEKSNYNIPGGKDDKSKDKKDPNSTQEDIFKLRLDNELKYANEVLQNERKLEDSRIAMMEDGSAKEMAIENLRFERLIEELEKKKVHIDEIAKLDDEASKALKSGDIAKFRALETIKQGWIERNKNLDAQINQQQEQEKTIHNNKIHQLELKQFDTSLKEMSNVYEHEKLLRDTANNNELIAVGDNATERERLKKEHAKKEYEAQLKHLQDLAGLMTFELYSQSALGTLSPEEKQAIQEKIDFYLNAISKLKAAEQGNQSKDGKEIDLGLAKGGDILGYSQKQWDNFFTNIDKGTAGFQTMAMAVGAATAIFTEIDKYQTASENARLKREEKVANTQKTRLKKQLDSGIISQTQYNKKVEKIDKELDNRKLEIEYAQAKRQRQLAILSIITNTAAAIMGIWKDVPKFDFGSSAFLLSAIVGGIGLAQIASIESADLPGHEEGLYPEYVNRQQDGKKFKVNQRLPMQSGLFNKPTILVGEAAGNDPEMVIDSRAWRKMPTPVKNSIINEIRGVKGYENGMYQNSITQGNQTTTAVGSNQDELFSMLMGLIAENTQTMKQLRDRPFIATMDRRNLKDMRDIDKGIADYKDLRNSNKQ